MIRTLVTVELAVLAAIWLVFLAAYGVLLAGYGSGSWRRSGAARQLVAMAAVSLAEVLGLLGLALDHRPPLWVYAAVYGAADVVMAGWLLLLWRSRRREE